MPAKAAQIPLDRPAVPAWVRFWLFALAGLVFAMVIVGGATRLTGSGLSITEWNPIMGAVPPLTDAAWQEAFDKYQAIPQYRLLNAGMTLGDFQFIFWWEWSHRQLGRAIGLVMGLGFLWGLVSGALRGRLALKVFGIFVLGGLQGAIGWIMVASGLEGDMTAVAPIKLMLHLTTAAVIYTLIISVATGLGPRHGFRPPAGAVSGTTLLLVLILVQIALGALVAGSKAGFVWNTWPLIDGDLIPSAERLFSGVPLIENFVDNTMLVQFNHRMSAYLVLIVAVLHAAGLRFSMPGSKAARRAVAVAGLTLAQGAIGVMTLLWVVPLWAGLLHQAFAFVVLGMAAAHRAALARG